MTRLKDVYAGLARLRRYRWRVRVGSSLCAFLTVAMLGVLAGFALDVSLHMGLLERVVFDLALLAIFVVTFRRTLAPAIRVHESTDQLALLVEGQQEIPGDLIAAVQFNDAHRSQFGSTDLRDAVVECVDEVGVELNFLEGFDTTRLKGILIRFIVVGLVSLSVLTVATEHVQIFASRMLLSRAPYPTDCIIREVVSPGPWSAYGHAVAFAVRLGGVLPDHARVELTGADGAMQTTVWLQPDANDASLFVGQLEHLYENAEYLIRAGDAVSSPRTITLVPLPKVTLQMRVDRPVYANKSAGETPDPFRNLVLEGSSVQPVVRSDKHLASATVHLHGKHYPMRRQGDTFILDPTGTPLAGVSQTTRFTVQVVDSDGLSLEEPISARVVVREDRPPRIAAAAVSVMVLPEAEPSVQFEAVDDYGLAQINLHQIVIPGSGAASRTQSSPLPILLPKHPEQVRRSVTIPLSSMNLHKGDRVEITLEAVDYRGRLPGKHTMSRKVIFKVTDKSGFEESLKDQDAQVDQKLDAIIRTQLQIGGPR